MSLLISEIIKELQELVEYKSKYLMMKNIVEEKPVGYKLSVDGCVNVTEDGSIFKDVQLVSPKVGEINKEDN